MTIGSEWDVVAGVRAGRLIRVLRDWKLPPANIVAPRGARHGRSARTALSEASSFHVNTSAAAAKKLRCRLLETTPYRDGFHCKRKVAITRDLLRVYARIPHL